jgi:HD-like signal output (HDOD) protein
MDTKSILLAVADPQALVDITQALGAEWETISVASEADALAQLEKSPFDALVVDFNLVSTDASELLNQALEKHPGTVRFLLAYEADLALVAAKVQGTPNIIPKPIESASLKSRIENGVNHSDPKQVGSDQANSPSDSPSIPAIYSQLLKTLESPGATNEQVGKIIARDESLTAELLRLTNSSYLGLPRNITDPVEAVESLGLEAVKALVRALQFLAEHSRLRPAYLSFDQIWQHSINVAQIARDLVLFETKDRKLASQALTAGLLHDLGKVVLVTNFDDLYGRVHSLARKQPVTLSDVEKEMFGANHGEIGACLVGMWNLPAAIVEATALHHEPPLGEDQELTPLAAVHIANVLEREIRPSDEDMLVAPIINTPFLNGLGLLQRLPVWRAAFANRRSGNLGLEVETAENDQTESSVLSSTTASRTGNQLPAPAAATRTTTSSQTGRRAPTVPAAHHRKRFAYTAVAAGVLLLLALWLRMQPDLDNTEPAYARTPTPQPAASVISPVVPPETAPAAPQVTPAVTVSEEPAPKPVSTETDPKPAASLPAPQPAVATAPIATSTNAPPPSVAPQEKAPPVFRIYAVIYSTVRPSAIVNGETVNVGDQVNGATVVAIGRTTVTLQINGQNKTYALR